MSAAIPRIGVDPEGRLAVTCWCERTIRYIRAGRVGLDTASCGAPECKPPKGRAS